MKNRINAVKRQHSTIKDIIPLLEKITRTPEVKAIIPGRIKPVAGNYPKPQIEFKVRTASGFKCIAKSSRSVQEIFIITDETDTVIKFLQEQKLIKRGS